MFAALLLFVGSIVDDTNSQASISASSSTIAKALVRNQTTIQLSGYLIRLGVFFFIFFFAYLRHYLTETVDNMPWRVNAASGGAPPNTGSGEW